MKRVETWQSCLVKKIISLTKIWKESKVYYKRNLAD